MDFPRSAVCLALLLALPAAVSAGCPFQHMWQNAPQGRPTFARRSLASTTSTGGSRTLSQAVYDQAAVVALDWTAIKADIAAALKQNQDFWPQDFGTYAPLMIRLAWHCSGSYRRWDGRGGCDGGRIRFDPELSWADNTNLDKARKILLPIKQKYGSNLSWGDLIVLSGNVALEQTGFTTPPLKFCAGRIDDSDGRDSLELGPSSEQVAVANCTTPGNCSSPLGVTEMELIYVNPEGPNGNPVPELSVPQIRSSFARMGFNDAEAVALIGGGHGLGKMHGACPTGPGPNPKQQPANPWPGTCGSGPLKGKGPNTFTTGFEGSWTSKPDKWSNEYYRNLLGFIWEPATSPGNKTQWIPTDFADTSDLDPNTDYGFNPAGLLPEVVMLTTDVALLRDREYREWTKLYARNGTALNETFTAAWFKLTHMDMGPFTRCIDKGAAPIQPKDFYWQPPPLPPPPSPLANFTEIKALLRNTTLRSINGNFPPDRISNTSITYAPLFSTLAWSCASSFRKTDYSGGCNGARIRFAPQKDWWPNWHMTNVLKVLDPIKRRYGNSLSWADLIVLAGNVAVEASGGLPMKFCGGRSDAADGSGIEHLAPRRYNNQQVEVKDTFKIMGLTPREGVALAARPRSAVHMQKLGYSGSWMTNASSLSNEYFKLLLSEKWQWQTAPGNKLEYKAVGKPLYMIPSDLVLKNDTQLLAIVKEFAQDNNTFLRAFADAWTKMMNADRFQGPAGSICT